MFIFVDRGYDPSAEPVLLRIEVILLAVVRSDDAVCEANPHSTFAVCVNRPACSQARFWNRFEATGLDSEEPLTKNAQPQDATVVSTNCVDAYVSRG